MERLYKAALISMSAIGFIFGTVISKTALSHPIDQTHYHTIEPVVGLFIALVGSAFIIRGVYVTIKTLLRQN